MPGAVDIHIALPADLAAELQTAADYQRRPANDLVREALEKYLAPEPAVPPILQISPPRTAAEAFAHMRERRKTTPLPEGVTIKDMIEYGRA